MTLKLNNDVYLVGDIHGDTSKLECLLQSYNLANLTLILLGDIGIFKYKDYKRYLRFDQFCKNNNIMVYALRGNHDNPGFFKPKEFLSKIAINFWNKFTNFKPLCDFTIVEYNSSRGIVLGGGLSIDRCVRRSYISNKNSNSLYSANDWWKGESFPNSSHIEDKFDFILSHTGPCPAKLTPLNEFNCSFFKIDSSLKDDIQKEMEEIKKARLHLNPKKWWYGHYHINDNFDCEGTHCCVVDINYLTPLNL